MKKILNLLCCVVIASAVYAQTPFNLRVTNPAADQVLKGQYQVSNYIPTDVVSDADEIVCIIKNEVSPDSLHMYLEKLESFHNRNTWSDTNSITIGVGAAREWIHNHFERVGMNNEGRLLASYLQFDLPGSALCGAGRFKNIFGVLPGLDPNDNSLIIIEAHMDSRCEDPCDLTCLAAGIDDNGSGTALVMELARVMTPLSFDHSIVFMATVGEEQGLFGADAFATYASDNNIPIKAVQNNDVVGGIYCGNTASPPTNCTEEGLIDSLQLRIFSFGNINSIHKSFARFTKTIYTEKLQPIVNVPMTLSLMQPEDRTGRGGDHIPFRQKGFTAIRFTEAHEHGHGNPSAPGYSDRQHTVHDILGHDTDGDLELDSLFVDFNYLARNTVINGVACALAAIGPDAPTIQITNNATSVSVTIDDPAHLGNYRIGVRTSLTDFDAMYTLIDTNYLELPNIVQGVFYNVSAASVDAKGVMGFFSSEESFSAIGSSGPSPSDTVLFNAPVCHHTGIDIQNSGDCPEPVNISAFPNPFSGNFNLKLEFRCVARFQIQHIEIYNLRGDRVLHKIIPEGIFSLIIPISFSVPNQTYICVVRSGSRILATERIIVTN